MLKKYLLILLLILPATGLLAQFESQMKHHVIIALDEVMPNEFWPQYDDAFQRVFGQRLVDTVLREGDYISFVGFSTDGTAKNLDDYTYLLHDSELGSLGWMPYNRDLRNKLKARWRYIMDQSQRKHNGPNKFSMISLAKMYAFAPVKKENARQYVNKTYVVLITDRRYNGLDIYEEAINITDFNGSITPMMMQDYGQRVGSEYFIRQLNNDYERQPRNRYIDLCEYIPLQSGLTLPTVLDYSAGNITAQRVKGGIYQLDINAASRNNPHYNLLQLRYRLKAHDGSVLLDTLCKASIGTNGDYEPINQFNVYYELGKSNNVASVTIDAWVGLNDGVYNATVLTPIDGAPEYLASEGLSVTIPIVYEKTARILGVIPLPGKLQFDDNQEFANTWVSAVAALLLILLLFALLVFIVRRLHTHQIRIDDIAIRKLS